MIILSRIPRYDSLKSFFLFESGLRSRTVCTKTSQFTSLNDYVKVYIGQCKFTENFFLVKILIQSVVLLYSIINTKFNYFTT